MIWGEDACILYSGLFFGGGVAVLGIGEGNGNPLQYSCLENPRDGGAWWAAIYGVEQSWTRLKRLSSSSCIRNFYLDAHQWADFMIKMLEQGSVSVCVGGSEGFYY